MTIVGHQSIALKRSDEEETNLHDEWLNKEDQETGYGSEWTTRSVLGWCVWKSGEAWSVLELWVHCEPTLEDKAMRHTIGMCCLSCCKLLLTYLLHCSYILSQYELLCCCWDVSAMKNMCACKLHSI